MEIQRRELVGIQLNFVNFVFNTVNLGIWEVNVQVYAGIILVSKMNWHKNNYNFIKIKISSKKQRQLIKLIIISCLKKKAHGGSKLKHS